MIGVITEPYQRPIASDWRCSRSAALFSADMLGFTRAASHGTKTKAANSEKIIAADDSTGMGSM